MSSRVPRVLLIAEAANPQLTSVPLVGWSLARALSDICDAHVATQVRNREAIEATGWTEGEQFTAIDSERIARPVHRLENLLRGGSGKGWTTVMAMRWLPYLYFERLVWKRFQADLRAGRFDLVHRITPLSPTLPSPIASKLAKLGIPFVIGPLNGGVPWPREFDGARRAEKEWLSYVRGAYKCLPGFHATRRHANAILVGSRDTLNQMPAQYHPKCHYMPENAIDPGRFNLQRTRQATRPLRCVFLGRFVPYKGPDMLLEAAAPLLRQGDITLQYIGDGPLLPELRQRVETEQIPGVEFLGWVEHRELQTHLINADLLTFPSIREFGGGVVLEAMALGVPPLIVNYGGPSELVDDQVGFTIPIGTREQIIRDLREKLLELAAKPQLIDQRGPAASRRVTERYTWPAKARQVLQIYGESIALNLSPDEAERHQRSVGQA